MKSKRILLVEDKYEDIISIQNSLKSLNGQHTLHVVHNINDALQVLMGGSSHYGMENYSQTGKVRPDIVLLNISFLQESAREFLEVMQKYYSLKNIKVYIIGDVHEILDPELALKYGIAGYLVKPFDLHNTLNEAVVHFRQELLRPGKALFSLPFLALNNKLITGINYLKTKAALYYLGSTAAAKVTASLAATVLVAGVLSSSTVRSSSENKTRNMVPANHKVPVVVNAPAVAECAAEETIVPLQYIPSEPARKNPRRSVSEPVETRSEIAAVSAPVQEALATGTVEKKYKIVAIEEEAE